MKIMLIVLSLCLLLGGCGRTPVEAAHFSVEREQTQIALDAPAGPVLAALGAPFGYGEQTSARGKGVERTYRFSGLDLSTYPGRGGERIYGVVITDASLRTPEGIAVGDTAARVRECFGPDAIQDGCCVLRRSREQMVVRLERNVVTAIEYSLI